MVLIVTVTYMYISPQAVTGAGLLATADTETQDSVPSPAPSVDESEVTSSTKQYVFKDPNFKVSTSAVLHI